MKNKKDMDFVVLGKTKSIQPNLVSLLALLVFSRGSIVFKFNLTSRFDSSGMLTLNNLPSESQIHWNIYFYHNTGQTPNKIETILQKGLRLAKRNKKKDIKQTKSKMLKTNKRRKITSL